MNVVNILATVRTVAVGSRLHKLWKVRFSFQRRGRTLYKRLAQPVCGLKNYI